MLTRGVMAAACAALLVAGSAQAAVISYQATQVNGATWRYDYTVTNDGAITADLRLFDIAFDPALYSEPSLAIVSAAGIATGWDELILQSGLNVPAQYDVLAKGAGIAGGETVAGFAVSFTWLGAGTPGPQDFAIYSPDGFALLGTGVTSAVPLPATALLMISGAAAALSRARRRRAT